MQKAAYGAFIHDTPFQKDKKSVSTDDSTLKELINAINNSAGEGSFSIGVFGKWGQGKTNLLMRLQEGLGAERKNTIIEFNPWKAASADKILEDFFETLSKSLKPYSSSAASQLKKYAQKTLGRSKELTFHATEALLDEIIPDSPLSERYNEINESIRLTGRRYIVFIDDVDRLSGAEIAQVFRIIRNTASFNNVFFVVAMDHHYVVEALANTKLFTKETEYLKKIFQFVIPLPPRPPMVYVEEFEKLLLEDNWSEKERENLLEGLIMLRDVAKVSSELSIHVLFEHYVDNFRDVKRLVNSFKISYRLIGDSVYFLDLLMLELLKNRHYSVYECILNRKLITQNQQDYQYWNVHSINWEKLKSQFNIHEIDSQIVFDTVKFILTKNDKKPTSQFARVNNYFLYASFQLFNLISPKLFRDLIGQDMTMIKLTFDNWIQDGKSDSLYEILDQYDTFESKEEYLKILRVYLMPGQKDGSFTNRAIHLIKDRAKYLTLFESEQDFRKELELILNDGKLGKYSRAQLAHDLLQELIYSDKSENVFTKNHLQRIIYNLFSAYLNEHLGYSHEAADFHLLNLDSRGKDRRVQLYSLANDALLRHLHSSQQNMEAYLRSIIRSHSLPNIDGEFALAPFTPDIFGSWEKFEESLKKYTVDDPDLKRLYNHTIAGIEAYKSGRDRFVVSDKSEQRWLLHHLRDNDQYSKLLPNDKDK
ncbi:hypothetical protein GCM10011379_28190 [Filimonas zeae]|uniref:KAP NTPase domain-containing protein n=1 Tax=Filimonas zeae TaxID=1737353 RepID=A0A917IZF2_9BACT|nr:hypothetical protein GCM10011379_28190 [Filimonas zeae]